MSRLLSITLAECRDYTDSSRKNCGNYWSQYLLCHMNLPFRYTSRLLSIALTERRDYSDSSRKSCGNYWSQYLLCHTNLPLSDKISCHYAQHGNSGIWIRIRFKADILTSPFGLSVYRLINTNNWCLWSCSSMRHVHRKPNYRDKRKGEQDCRNLRT